MFLCDMNGLVAGFNFQNRVAAGNRIMDKKGEEKKTKEIDDKEKIISQKPNDSEDATEN